MVPQKHTVFRVKCPKHIPEMPLTGDLTTGVYWRPEGKEYLAGSPNSVFDATDLEPAWNDFEELVWPALAQRIPAFEELKLTGGWAGYYDCNKLDNNAVVGKHPKYENVYMASGFTGRGLMQAPGIGRALTELLQLDHIKQLILVILLLKEYWIIMQDQNLTFYKIKFHKKFDIFEHLKVQLIDNLEISF